MSKKKYIFEYKITGRCSIEIEASNQEEAIAILKKRETSPVLEEWDVEYYQDFASLSDKDIMRDCASIDDIEEEV